MSRKSKYMRHIRYRLQNKRGGTEKGIGEYRDDEIAKGESKAEFVVKKTQTYLARGRRNESLRRKLDNVI